MIQQLLSRSTSTNPMETDGTAKDPRNPQAVTIMALPALPLAWKALNAANIWEMATIALPLVVFAASFAALLKGMAVTAEHEKATSAKRPTIPFKIVGSLGLALGVVTIVATKNGTVVQCAQYGIAAGVLSLLSFGIDPLRDKELDTPESRALHEMRKIAHQLSARIATMQIEIDALNLPDLSEQVTDLGMAVTFLCDAASDDPMRIRGLRRHFGPIFDGVEQATQSFSRLYRSDPEPDALDTFNTLLCEIEDEYHERARQFARDGSTKLDVQSDVLRHMIKRA